MTQHEIRREYGVSFKNIYNDLCFTPDYMGKVCGANDVANVLGIKYETVKAWVEQMGLKKTKYKTSFMPTRVEDTCWVKYGITIKSYLKRRSICFSCEQMANELNTDNQTIRRLLRKYKLSSIDYLREKGKCEKNSYFYL